MKSFLIKVGKRWHNVQVEELRGPLARVMVDGEIFEVEIEEGPEGKESPRPATQGRPAPAIAKEDKGDVAVTEETKRIVAPVHARVVAVMVRKGQRISDGMEVCVLEAMKMEQSIRASMGGVVKAIYVRPGQNVAQGDLLIELE